MYLTGLMKHIFFLLLSSIVNLYKKEEVNPKKVYAIDSGLINSVSASLNNNFGRLFENMLYIHLRRNFSSIFYYKTRKNYEIDFVVSDSDPAFLVQACYDISNQETRHRELRALEEAMDELKIKQAFLVNQNEASEYQVSKNVNIKIVPAWRFLMESVATIER